MTPKSKVLGSNGKELPQKLVNEIQNYTGFPWWNGMAFAEYVGYPQRVRTLELALGDAIDDMWDVMEWLREEKQFDKADRIRIIMGRAARALDSQHGPADAIRIIAKGWK